MITFIIFADKTSAYMKTSNPFPTVEYISPDYFCDREAEQKQIIESIENHRNITVVSHRRLGKTALIKHCYHLMKRRKDVSLHFIDIYATQNLTDFINLFAVSLLGYYESVTEKVLNRVTNVLGRFRPKLTFNELTGAPSFELSLQSESDTGHCLSAIFEYLSEQQKQIVIAIDEFQQITAYPEKNIEALLRTHIQNCPNVTMIFSGSNKRMITSMFNDYARPFYQSSGFLFLNKIDQEKYIPFIRRHFHIAGRDLKDEAIRFIFEWTLGHTYFVQELCNRLYSLDTKIIEENDCKLVADRILRERAPLYTMHRNLLTKAQFKLLRAIAHEGYVKQINSSELLRKYKLVAASTVNRALMSLEKGDLITQEEEEGYVVNDIFLMRWLQQQ